jgi:hypothetical protein
VLDGAGLGAGTEESLVPVDGSLLDFLEASAAFGAVSLASKLARIRAMSLLTSLGLAMYKKGRLATMDKGVSELLAERSLEREFVVMI